MEMKTWFITGASSGFGLAFAEHAIEQGHNVIAAARRVAHLDSLRALAPDQVLSCELDVTQPQQVDSAVKQAFRRFSSIDVLVNNAGYGIVGAFEETPDSELRAQIETNFFGAMNLIRAVLPKMRQQMSGAIVNISSMGGQMSFAGFSAYSASKFALEGVSEALAQEVAPFGIKVLIVEPGQFRTNLAGEGMRHMPEMTAYGQTVGATRAFAHSMHGTQPGDPRKAAAAIDFVVRSEKTPLRLPLGADAIEAIRKHAQSLLADIDQWESLASDTRITDAG